MKKISHEGVKSILFIGFLLMLSFCKKGDSETTFDMTKRLLTSGTWKLSSALVDGVDRTDVYSGLTVEFQDGTFKSSTTTPSWPETGTYILIGETGAIMQRSDGIEIGILSITETNLILDFVWSRTTLGPGRSSSVVGSHRLTFTK